MTLVRIDTQDVLLEQQKTGRLIEVGLSNNLTIMAKRTVTSQYEAKDATLSIKRQLLSGDGDLAEIYYEVAPQAEANQAPAVRMFPSTLYCSCT